MTDHLATTQNCEFINDFANKLPMAVMCQLLGVPNEDLDKFRVWTADITFVFSLARGGDIQAVVGLNGYVDSLIADKTVAPAGDLISALIIDSRPTRRRSPQR